MEQLEYKELEMINERLVAENERLKSDNEKMKQELRDVEVDNEKIEQKLTDIDVLFSKLTEDIKRHERDIIAALNEFGRAILNESRSDEQELTVDASSDM